MMRKPLPIGLKNYEKMKERYYTVDKTLLIKEFLERGNEVTLITRPRRFGKTINMSMMSEFFDITKDSKKLFQDTKIMETDYANQINQYPIIFISFANAKGDIVNVVRQIKNQLLDEYNRYDYIFINLTRIEDNRYEKILNDLMDSDNGKIDASIDGLSFLMRILEKYYGREVMLFIDEYDIPFIEAYTGGFYDELCRGLSTMLHNALKTSDSLQYAMLTGIQRVAKENLFSDLNNLKVCTVGDEHYSQYFGFDENETKVLLEYYGLSLDEKVKSMYDGYRFGNKEIYNPWSILNYADNRKLEPYWLNTSNNKMIKNAIKKADKIFEAGYEELIETGKIETRVQMETSFFEVNTTASLWGLFINAGYLTIEKQIDIQRYVLRIPNQEVQQEFKDLTSYHLHVSDTLLADLFDSLLYEEKENFIYSYKQLLLTLPSYRDLKDENSYHVLFLGMCAWLSHDYEIISNREEGKGRCDIILKAKKDNLPSYVLEFKYLKDTDNLKTITRQAIEQIKEKRYDASLKGKVISIGLAHHIKDIEIEWVEK